MFTVYAEGENVPFLPHHHKCGGQTARYPEVAHFVRQADAIFCATYWTENPESAPFGACNYWVKS